MYANRSPVRSANRIQALIRGPASTTVNRYCKLWVFNISSFGCYIHLIVLCYVLILYHVPNKTIRFKPNRLGRRRATRPRLGGKQRMRINARRKGVPDATATRATQSLSSVSLTSCATSVIKTGTEIPRGRR